MSVLGAWTAAGLTPVTGDTWVSYAGSSWFAVTRDSGGLVTVAHAATLDGAWSTASIPGLDSVPVAHVGKVIHGGGVWAVLASSIGSVQVAWTTDLGAAWTVTTIAATVYDVDNASDANADCMRLAYGDGTWVVVGWCIQPDWFNSPIIGYCASITGTWTWVTGTATGWQRVGDIAHDGTTWVAAGIQYRDAATVATVLTSTTLDGTWTAPSTPPDNASTNDYLLNVNGTHVLAFAAGYWVAVAYDDTSTPGLWTASDPTGTWTLTDAATLGLATGEQVQDATYGAGGWVLTGSMSGPVWGRDDTSPAGAYTAVTGHGFTATAAVTVATDGSRVAVGAAITGEVRYTPTTPAPAGTPRRHLRQRQRPW